jgi:hypothetical protein
MGYYGWTVAEHQDVSGEPLSKFDENTRVVVFMGKTGAGKTSTINSLFGLSWPTDNAVACTGSPMMAVVQTGHRRVLVVDMPGIAESVDADAKYAAYYRYYFPRANHIVWVLQADTRSYAADQQSMCSLVNCLRENASLTFAVNRIDQIGAGDWDVDTNSPSPWQAAAMAEKQSQVNDLFEWITDGKISTAIACVSASTRYGIEILRDLVIAPGGDG